MWPQTYTPAGGSLLWSAAVAALPIAAALLSLALFRLPSWKASLFGLATAAAVALFAYRMPTGLMLSAAAYGAAFGLFPIGWIVFSAILLYRVTVVTGKFEIIKQSMGAITGDERLQALLIAFAFGAFLEGAAGFGTPVAVAAAMLAGLGFAPLRAAGVCLLANTAPVAFGAIAIPLVTLAGVTGLPLASLSADVGRLCAPVSLFIPAYLVLVMGGWASLLEVFPAAAVCGLAFASTQFLVSNFIGPAPHRHPLLARRHDRHRPPPPRLETERRRREPPATLTTAGAVFAAWLPYLLLVVFVLAWGAAAVKQILNAGTFAFPWPGLHNQILRLAPAVTAPSPYAAPFTFNLLSAAGTACLFAALASAIVLAHVPSGLRATPPPTPPSNSPSRPSPSPPSSPSLS